LAIRFEYGIVEHHHSSCRCFFGQWQGAFRYLIEALVFIGYTLESFMHLQRNPCVEPDKLPDCIQQVGSFPDLKVTYMLVGTLYIVFVLAVVVHQADVGMLGDGHVMDYMQYRPEIKEGFVKAAHAQLQSAFPPKESLPFVWVVEMVGAFKIQVRPYRPFIDLGNIAAEEIILLYISIVSQYFQGLYVDILVDLALGLDDLLFQRACYTKDCFQHIIISGFYQSHLKFTFYVLSSS